MAEEAMLNLRWDLFSSQLATTLDTCYEKQYFVDTSLVCRDGTIIKCHKMVLANSSTFFRRILMKNDHPHPMIVLHDIEVDDLKTIVNFMYSGEIEVLKSEVRRLLRIAEVLEVSGLKDIRSSAQFQKTYRAELGGFPGKTTDKNDSSPTSPGNSTIYRPQFSRQTTEKSLKQTDISEKSGQMGFPQSLPQNLSTNFSPKIKVLDPRQITEVLSPKNTPSIDVNYGFSRRDSRRPPRTRTPDQLRQKRGPDDGTQYLKKLKLLGEIDIIRRPEPQKSTSKDTFEGPYPAESPGLPARHRSENGNSVDEPGNFEVIEKIDTLRRRNSFSSSGIEIFRANYPGEYQDQPGSSSRPDQNEPPRSQSRNSVETI